MNSAVYFFFLAACSCDVNLVPYFTSVTRQEIGLK